MGASGHDADVICCTTPACSLHIGNVKPVGDLPEGTVICNVEEKPGDRGSLARASGEACAGLRALPLLPFTAVLANLLLE